MKSSLFVVLVMLLAFPLAFAEVPSRPRTAVLVVDVQPCFVTGGSLAVAGADAAYVNDVQQGTKWLHQKGYVIYGSRDYHPENHISFYTNHKDVGAKAFDLICISGTPENCAKWQVMWPPHCVQTAGDSAALVDNNLFAELIKKGQDNRYDSYSAFKDDGGADTELHAILQARGVTRLIVYGIATDYCVAASVLAALNHGYEVVVVQNLIRGVAPDTSAKAITEMTKAGAVFKNSVQDAFKYLER